jgi:hypothetical protein
MARAQTYILGILVAGVLVFGVFEHLRIGRLNVQIAMLRDENKRLGSDAANASRELEDAKSDIAALQSENSQLRHHTVVAMQDTAQPAPQSTARPNTGIAMSGVGSTLAAWLDRVNSLKDRLLANPAAQIPEMSLLTDEDWLNAARQANLQTDDDYRKALGGLRNAAEGKVQGDLSTALAKYAKANNQQFPDNMNELQPYFDTPMDPAILARWQITTGPDGGKAVWLQQPVDVQYDNDFGARANGAFTISPGSANWTRADAH